MESMENRDERKNSVIFSCLTSFFDCDIIKPQKNTDRIYRLPESPGGDADSSEEKGDPTHRGA